MNALSFDYEACNNLPMALQKEWLKANPIGGYSSSTILSVNTKRSHGLLVAQLQEPLGHFVMLSCVDEIVHIDDMSYPISSRFQSGRMSPNGCQYLKKFTLLPVPTWEFHIDDIVLQKKLVFLHDEQTVLIQYRIIEGDEDLVRLELRPMTAFRHVEDLSYYNENLSTQIERSDGQVSYAGLQFYHNAAILDQAGEWYRGIEYREEKRAGREFEEDLYSPFRLMYAFGDRRENYFCASLKHHKEPDFEELFLKEITV